MSARGHIPASRYCPPTILPLMSAYKFRIDPVLSILSRHRVGGSTFLFANGQNILDAQQDSDIETGKFFMPVMFDSPATTADLATLQAGSASSQSR